jgi:hypothetical protein
MGDALSPEILAASAWTTRGVTPPGVTTLFR